jgi:4-aminobutyrate aminotransferase
VRGLGLMIGVAFAHNDGKPDVKFRDQVMSQCFEQGLLLLSCGDSTIRFCPALIVKRAEVDIAVGIFDAVLTELRG